MADPFTISELLALAVKAAITKVTTTSADYAIERLTRLINKLLPFVKNAEREQTDSQALTQDLTSNIEPLVKNVLDQVKNDSEEKDFINSLQELLEHLRNNPQSVKSLKQLEQAIESKVLWIKPEFPGGPIPCDSPFYIKRSPAEDQCYEAILQPGALVRIKAPSKMGATSLMNSILNYSSINGYRTVAIPFRLTEADVMLSGLDNFLRWFCATVSDDLNLPEKLQDYWQGTIGSMKKCSNYLEKFILPGLNSPLVLGLDDLDRIFSIPAITDGFLSLLRTWHENARRQESEIWKNFNLILSYSTEVPSPIDNYRSPFNVGLPIELRGLTQEQVRHLIDRYQISINSDHEFNKIYNLFGGHPYLIQVLLYEMYYERLTITVVLNDSSKSENLFKQHLESHLRELGKDLEVKLAFKQIVEAEIPIQIEPWVSAKLQDMGLVKVEGNALKPFCNLYKQYFSERIR